MPADSGDRQAVSTLGEDVFVELFAQVFGIEKVQMLVHEYPVEDIYGGGRFIDYAIRTPDDRIAFEIDGLTWHLPSMIPIEKYEDDLLRQNSLVHQGWRVFRWTERELIVEPHRVKQQLALFLKTIPGLLAFDDFLPKQGGELFELRPHQQEALDWLTQMRAEGRSIGLVTHAQGAGKTIVAISDARRLGGRTLFLAHRRELVLQAHDKLKELWPDASAGVYMANVREDDCHNVAASIQSVADRLADFSPAAFEYLIIDEAHHAAAPIYRRVLGYFRPRFVLGLTATPDRADGQSILDIFCDCAHRLTLREAIEKGQLVPIRCVRVRTNVDLSRVRFNQVQYNRKDIEETVVVPARDQLIVDTYRSHVPGRKAVAFCVNVRHGESLAELFRSNGVAARSVSGRMPRGEREEYLQEFRDGELRVLCACDILNEGWDCPNVEVLLMARPTLSKVVYLQQLGRGTRKAPGKECLTVFDFVDNSTRYNQAYTLNRAAGERSYRPGGLLLAPETLRKAEDEALRRGQRPTAVLDIGLWVREYQEIDLFDWQEQLKDMISVTQLEIELAAPEGTVRRAVERELIQPDHTQPLGQRTYHYFHRDRSEDVRLALGLRRVEETSIKALFLDYVAEMDLTTSYKPVMLLAILDSVAQDGRARISDVASKFREFYGLRKAAGLVVERSNSRMANIEAGDSAQGQRIMLEMPFEKFERRRYLMYARDVAFIRFEPRLWRQLTPDDLVGLRTICEQSIARYYERLSQGR
ncbi:MAG TPA: DEAD/DEAH box helicase family protein [Pirellulales bacterium]|jgi:superfamily II DNA or RNA helicase|nr:DEAD/DEAH box helicase family protein [Pirellulales bacterium]